MSEERSVEQARAERLGAYLKSLRAGLEMTLRDVEDATERKISNAYLSQVENGKVRNPSPSVLHALSSTYNVPYTNLMERAGYLSPPGKRAPTGKHGRAATHAVEKLTVQEEEELLKYLAWYRSRRNENP